VDAAPEPFQRKRAPSFVQCARRRDGEGDLDTRAALVDVLAAGAARARETDLQLVGGDRHRSGAEVVHLGVLRHAYSPWSTSNCHTSLSVDTGPCCECCRCPSEKYVDFIHASK